MCMFALLPERGILAKLIKQALTYVNKSIIITHFENRLFDWRRAYQRRIKLLK